VRLLLSLFTEAGLDERNVCHAAPAGPRLALMSLVRWIAENKDFLVAISVLLSPFAAVFVGLMGAKAVMKSTRLQVRSASLRDVRQRNLEKLRDECAAEIYAIAELKKEIEAPDVDSGKALRSIDDGMEARMVRISLLISAESRNVYDEWLTREAVLCPKLMSRKRGQELDPRTHSDFERTLNELTALAKEILDIEESRAGRK
jgi:hypothetical protein